MSRRLLAVVAAVTLAGVAAAVAFFGCGQPPAPALADPDLFADVTADSGVAFTYRNGEDRTPPHLSILESLGGGGAALDFDGDGRCDLFLTGGGHFGGTDGKDILGHPCKLYRNLGNFRFTEVPLDAPISGWFYSHGAAVADYDRDGWPDLFVTGWRRMALFHNEADGHGGRKLVDVTKAAGLGTGIEWATSAGWADLDGDGFPDLYVCQYVNWSFANHPACSYDGGKTPDICPPKVFAGLTHKLFRNAGGKAFEDVGTAAGLVSGSDDASKGLGVVLADLDGDGKPDVYAANDSVPNFLYQNVSVPGTIRLREVALRAGVAMDAGGRPTGSMGVDVGDPECTGKPALLVTNFENETHAVYRNRSRPGELSFEPATEAVGVSGLGRQFVGWGTGFADLDRDGWEDVVIAHGHAVRYPMGAPRRQRGVILLNEAGKFRERSARGGVYFSQPHPARGLILGDFDNDGRIDAVVSHVNEPVAVLRNVSPTGPHWVGVELRGKDHSDVVGARVVLEAGGRTQTRFAKGGGGYVSSGDRRLLFGLGSTERIDSLTVLWPDGTSQKWADVAPDCYHAVEQGRTGLLAPPTAEK